MTTIINAVASTGLTQTADGSGIIKVQSNGVTTNALAWVNFNGTGTVAIRSSYNVSSITDNGTGDYTVNFAAALSDANYSAVFGGARLNGSYNSIVCVNNTSPVYTTSALRITVIQTNDALVDIPNINVAIFGN